MTATAHHTVLMRRASLPNWPRRLSAELAAAYLGISVSSFRQGVATGRYPQPIRDGRRVLWDRKRLDEIVDLQSGLGNDSGGW